MAGEILWINDTDAREKGIFVVPGLRGIMGLPPRPISIERVIGRHGGVKGARGFHMWREIEIPAVFVTDAIEDLNEDWAVVQQELLQEDCRLRHTYAPDLEYLAEWVSEDATFEGQALEPEQAMIMRFIAAHPFGRHITGSPFSVDFDSTPTAIPSGLHACRGTIFLRGGTNPIVTLYANDGVTALATMGFTQAHTGDQETRVESHLHKVTFAEDELIDGVSARASLTSGQFIEVDPVKWGADVAAGEWLKLAVNDGEGTFVYDKYS